MKIRTDFVTNSSSSSFVVRLCAELADGVTMKFMVEETGGDECGTSVVFSAVGQNGESICKEGFDESDLDGASSITWYVDMMKINGAKSAKALVTAIKKPFFGKAKEAFSDEECMGEFEGSDFMILDELLGMEAPCDRFMRDHIKDISDVKNVVVTYEFGGRGDALAEPLEILVKLFGGEDGTEIYETIDENDEAQAAKILAKMRCLKKADKETVSGLVKFVKECECAPEECKVVLSVNEDGTLHYEIDYRYEI